MTIGNIRNTWLRRAALLLYAPLFLVISGILGIAGALFEGAQGAFDGWCDVTEGTWRVLRECW